LVGPTILQWGTEEQKKQFIPGILKGTIAWCQGFSEPDAGSDLASLSTRAVRDGEEWVLNGSKIWTSGAHLAQFGILLARTNPDAPKRKGISYFICPMHAPGITMAPIVDMTGAHSFNQVFFDDARIPADCLVGDVNDGWRLAKATLANERVSLSSGGVLWGSGPSAADLIEVVRNGGAGAAVRADPVIRQELARTWIEGEVLRLIQLRALSARLSGRTPGPEASVQKLMADEHGQRVMALAKQLAGPGGMLDGSGPVGKLPPRRRGGATEIKFAEGLVPGVERVWHYGYLFAPALTIGGGTWAVQRNIIAEWVLGLPRDP
jgi:alkylation response protein AidB-like acyl-CoA dehydrogenase